MLKQHALHHYLGSLLGIMKQHALQRHHPGLTRMLKKHEMFLSGTMFL
jgi:hypothetical protein